jgi:phosphoribosyl-ATP pyrophosphohydrolase
MSRFTAVLERLAATIESRRGGDASTSYTAQLLGDLDRAAKKLGEEAVETVIASLAGDKAAVTSETADLLYHLLVVLALSGVTLQDVYGELERRTGRSGLAEKAARPKD